MNKNDILREVRIDDYGSDGGGIARIDGCVVFVQCGARGDLCDLRVVKVRPTHAFAIIERLIEPSPERVENDCPYYPKCGGCDMRHISYDAECAMKRSRVADALTRIGGVPTTEREARDGGALPAAAPPLYVPEILRSVDIDGYRNKAIFQVDGASVGLFRRRTHDVVDVVRCRLQADGSGAFCDAYRVAAAALHLCDVRWLFHRENRSGAAAAAVVAKSDALMRTDFADHIKRACPHVTELSLIVNRSDSNVVMRGERHILYGEPLVDTLCGFEFEISPFSFYQVNRARAERLYAVAVEYAELSGTETVLDLYCGIGTLTLALAACAVRVLGAEIVPEAVADARRNAERNGVSNAEFICADASELAAEGGAYDVVVLDPPRSGLERRAIDAIAQIGPKRIVYVSCDPATLARDIALFAPLGYAPDRIQPVDMFPRTRHVECVARLVRCGA